MRKLRSEEAYALRMQGWSKEQREKRTSSLASSTFLYGCMIPGSWTLTTLNSDDEDEDNMKTTLFS
jgi:hypothetical protein